MGRTLALKTDMGPIPGTTYIPMNPPGDFVFFLSTKPVVIHEHFRVWTEQKNNNERVH